jgi:hypothetical protein
MITENLQVKLMELCEEQKEQIRFLQAQVQALGHRLNCLSDKVSDQAVIIGKLID